MRDCVRQNVTPEEAKLHEMSIDLAAMRGQAESWERGYYRELTRRKAYERIVEDLYALINERDREIKILEGVIKTLTSLL